MHWKSLHGRPWGNDFEIQFAIGILYSKPWTISIDKYDYENLCVTRANASIHEYMIMRHSRLMWQCCSQHSMVWSVFPLKEEHVWALYFPVIRPLPPPAGYSRRVSCNCWNDAKRIFKKRLNDQLKCMVHHANPWVILRKLIQQQYESAEYLRTYRVIVIMML